MITHDIHKRYCIKRQREHRRHNIEPDRKHN